jgi:hypothetical protein
MFQRGKGGQASLNHLSTNSRDSLQTFSETLNLMTSVTRDSDRLATFSRLVSHFAETFGEIRSEHVAEPSIRSALEGYCRHCAALGQSILSDVQLAQKMFGSLSVVFVLMGSSLPSAADFVPLFVQIVQSSRGDPNLFDVSLGFLSLLFRTTGFFHEFQALDGFALIFSSFFLAPLAHIQSSVIQLLFESSACEKCLYTSSPTLLDIAADALTAADSPTIAVFLANYLSFCFLSDPSIFTKFKDEGHFLFLNSFMLSRCDQQTIVKCYTVMLTKSDLDASVVQAFFELFLSPSCAVELRSVIVKLVVRVTNLAAERLAKIESTFPIGSGCCRRPSCRWSVMRH